MKPMILIILIFCMIGENSNTITNVMQICTVSLPKNINTRNGILTEEKFDSTLNDLKDTISFNVDNLTIELGEQLTNYKYINIHTKAIMTKTDNTKKRLLIDRNGIILYQKKYYQAPPKTMKLLRGSFD